MKELHEAEEQVKDSLNRVKLDTRNLTTDNYSLIGPTSHMMKNSEELMLQNAISGTRTQDLSTIVNAVLHKAETTGGFTDPGVIRVYNDVLRGLFTPEMISKTRSSLSNVMKFQDFEKLVYCVLRILEEIDLTLDLLRNQYSKKEKQTFEQLTNHIMEMISNSLCDKFYYKTDLFKLINDLFYDLENILQIQHALRPKLEEEVANQEKSTKQADYQKNLLNRKSIDCGIQRLSDLTRIGMYRLIPKPLANGSSCFDENNFEENIRNGIRRALQYGGLVQDKFIFFFLNDRSKYKTLDFFKIVLAEFDKDARIQFTTLCHFEGDVPDETKAEIFNYEYQLEPNSASTLKIDPSFVNQIEVFYEDEVGLYNIQAKVLLAIYQILYRQLHLDRLPSTYFRKGPGDVPQIIITMEHLYSFLAFIKSNGRTADAQARPDPLLDSRLQDVGMLGASYRGAANPSLAPLMPVDPSSRYMAHQSLLDLYGSAVQTPADWPNQAAKTGYTGSTFNTQRLQNSSYPGQQNQEIASSIAPSKLQFILDSAQKKLDKSTEDSINKGLLNYMSSAPYPSQPAQSTANREYERQRQDEINRLRAEREEKERKEREMRENRMREEDKRRRELEEEDRQKREALRRDREERERKDREERERKEADLRAERERRDRERKEKEDRDRVEREERDRQYREEKERRDREQRERDERDRKEREERERRDREERERARKDREEKEKEERDRREREEKEKREKKEREDREKREREEAERKDRERRDKEERERREKEDKERREKERIEREEKDRRDREDRERKEKEDRERREKENKERLAKEQADKEKRDREERERQLLEEQRRQKEKEDREKREQEDRDRKAKEEKDRQDKIDRERKEKEAREQQEREEQQRRDLENQEFERRRRLKSEEDRRIAEENRRKSEEEAARQKKEQEAAANAAKEAAMKAQEKDDFEDDFLDDFDGMDDFGESTGNKKKDIAPAANNTQLAKNDAKAPVSQQQPQPIVKKNAVEDEGFDFGDDDFDDIDDFDESKGKKPVTPAPVAPKQQSVAATPTPSNQGAPKSPAPEPAKTTDFEGGIKGLRKKAQEQKLEPEKKSDLVDAFDKQVVEHDNPHNHPKPFTTHHLDLLDQYLDSTSRLTEEIISNYMATLANQQIGVDIVARLMQEFMESKLFFLLEFEDTEDILQAALSINDSSKIPAATTKNLGLKLKQVIDQSFEGGSPAGIKYYVAPFSLAEDYKKEMIVQGILDLANKKVFFVTINSEMTEAQFRNEKKVQVIANMFAKMVNEAINGNSNIEIKPQDIYIPILKPELIEFLVESCEDPYLRYLIITYLIFYENATDKYDFDGFKKSMEIETFSLDNAKRFVTTMNASRESASIRQQMQTQPELQEGILQTVEAIMNEKNVQAIPKLAEAATDPKQLPAIIKADIADLNKALTQCQAVFSVLEYVVMETEKIIYYICLRNNEAPIVMHLSTNKEPENSKGLEAIKVSLPGAQIYFDNPRHQFTLGYVDIFLYTWMIHVYDIGLGPVDALRILTYNEGPFVSEIMRNIEMGDEEQAYDPDGPRPESNDDDGLVDEAAADDDFGIDFDDDEAEKKLQQKKGPGFPAPSNAPGKPSQAPAPKVDPKKAPGAAYDDEFDDFDDDNQDANFDNIDDLDF